MRLVACVLLAFAAILSHPAHAQDSASQFVGDVIRDIDIRGLKRIEAEAVRAKLQARAGEKLEAGEVSADIRALFQMGYFDEITVQAERAAGGVRLIYQLRERPVIAELVFEGNDKISTKDLQETVKVKEWSILDVNLVREDVGRIEKYYEERGYYLAKVNYEVVKTGDDEVRLVFRIRDFDKVRIKKIIFLNNRHFSDDQLKSILAETQEGGLFSFLSGSGNFKESAFKQDLNRLMYWYLDHGFLKFRYENPVVTVSDDKKWLYISIFVDEGEQYTVSDVDFSGELLFSREELQETLTLEGGDVFSITKRNLDIQRLTEMYQDLGYAFVNVVPRMEFDEPNKRVSMAYHFEKGQLVHFGEINVAGNSKTYDTVIRRELRINEGELYSGTNLRISRERVERLGYFAPGEVIFNEITRKGRDDIVDIEIQVKERSTGTITLGAGYGSASGFFLTTQISEINLLGKGQTLSLQGQYSADARQRSFNLGFLDPYAFDTKWSLGFDLFYVRFLLPEEFLAQKLGFNLKAGYPITDDIQAFITYKNEGLRIVELESPDINVEAEEGVLSSVVWTLVRDVRNNRFETTSGNYQALSLETAGLGGDKRFIKWKLNNRYYRPVVGPLVFRSSFELGQLYQVGDNRLPRSELFYLGGPNNMRGFDFGDLQGTVQLFLLSELEYPLVREAGLKGVVFFDAGNAFNEFPGTGDAPFTIRTDAGFGIRWFSPIGPLRFEWGYPLKRRPGENPSEFHFFIGQPF